VTFTARDAAGNTATATIMVTVVDSVTRWRSLRHRHARIFIRMF
jgi:hypothetical protein